MTAAWPENEGSGEDNPVEAGGYFRQWRSGHDLARTDNVAQAMANYIYAIGDRSSGEAVLIDPAYAPVELVDMLGAEGMHLTGVLATHHHSDHVGGHTGGFAIPGIAELLETTDVPIHVQKAEVPYLEETTGVERSSLVTHESGDVINVGSIAIRCIHTPGHTPGSQCFLIDGLLLTGDTLFIEGCGRMDTANGDPAEMYESLYNRLSPIAEDTKVFPGHAYSPLAFAPMGAVRKFNPVFFEHSKEEWLAHYGN